MYRVPVLYMNAVQELSVSQDMLRHEHLSCAYEMTMAMLCHVLSVSDPTHGLI